MLIDAHVNITEDGQWYNTSYDASLERLMREMDESGIEKCLLISMPFATTNKYVASVVEKYPEKFKGLGHIDFSGDPVEQVAEIIKMNLSGVKLHPRIQGLDCTDSLLEPFFKYLNDRKMLVMIDGYYQTPSERIHLYDLLPFKYDILAKKYRDINFILSHLGGHRVLDTYFLVKSNRNVYTDISHVLKYFDGSSVIADCLWVLERLDQKIIYGSDFPEYDLKAYLTQFEQLSSRRPGIKKEHIFSTIKMLVDFEN